MNYGFTENRAEEKTTRDLYLDAKLQTFLTCLFILSLRPTSLINLL